MPEHYLHLDGAATISTRAFQRVARDLDELIEHQAMGVVHGPAGLGKSFAVEAALENLRNHYRKTAQRLTIVGHVFPHRCTVLRVAEGLAQALLRTKPTTSTKDRFVLQEMVREQLIVSPHLLVIDEAQRLTTHTMEVLRFFYDDPDTKLTVLFVGGDGCWETISREPMLVSRIYRRRQFRPLPLREVPALMHQYHQLYAHADPALLADVDATFAHGNWRSWVSFTATALDIAQDAGRNTLDDEIVANAYYSLGCDDPDL
jgi:hypothetical protein